MSVSGDDGDDEVGTWGENEICFILFAWLYVSTNWYAFDLAAPASLSKLRARGWARVITSIDLQDNPGESPEDLDLDPAPSRAHRIRTETIVPHMSNSQGTE